MPAPANPGPSEKRSCAKDDMGLHFFLALPARCASISVGGDDMDMKSMTIEQLTALVADAQAEIARRQVEAETLEARLVRLGVDAGELNAKRIESLQRAHELGVEDAALCKLAKCVRLSRRSDILLPAHKYEGLSRGRGWARHGRGDSAEWGEREDGCYRVALAGRWTVGGHDGFSRKGQVQWDVDHVVVGDQTWTIAD